MAESLYLDHETYTVDAAPPDPPYGGLPNASITKLIKTTGGLVGDERHLHLDVPTGGGPGSGIGTDVGDEISNANSPVSMALGTT